MFRYATIIALGLFVSGCAMPAPLKFASWAVDGVSYLTTQKSVMDHGLSALNGQDCAVMRLATEGAACRSEIPGVAFNDNLSPSSLSPISSRALKAAESACDTSEIAQDLPAGGKLNSCAQRLTEAFGKDGAAAECERRIAYLVAQSRTDDAAIWIGVQAAVQQAPDAPDASAAN